MNIPMKPPYNSEDDVTQYLNDIRLLSHNFYQVIIEVQHLFHSRINDVTETIKYGGIVFCHNNSLIAGVFSYKGHVSVEFSHGVEFDDPDNILEGKGRFRRHIKLQCTEDIDSKRLATFIKECKTQLNLQN